MALLKRGLLVLVAALAAAPAASAGAPRVDVVVTLDDPPLAQAPGPTRGLFGRDAGRLLLHADASRRHLRTLAAAQRRVERTLAQRVPAARVHRRYSIVANGFALSVPQDEVARLESMPGVAQVWPSVRYRARLDRSPSVIGAPALWGAALASAGNGIKIGIIDDGIEHTHDFFSGTGFTMPPGFPKGQHAYTNAKVIAARAFAPRSPAYSRAALPFDPQHSEHATHVAGIAAGNAGTRAEGRTISGVAPRAYLGNYKVLTIPTASGVGLDGNSPEIVAGVEAAVADGMDVINLSLGEPEITPSRDIVVRALNAAADAGVVPVVAAGNDFDEFGRGSISSPGTAAKAITAAAATDDGEIAGFSSSGPTPISLQLKPDVTAPGVSILSSVPVRSAWSSFSGTSMAAPHVAGAAALLLHRRPDWTPAQVKSALTTTAKELGAPVTRQGAGLVNLPAALEPKVQATPTSISFGAVAKGSAATRMLEIADAGGGAGVWTVRVVPTAGALTIQAPATASVPARMELTAVAPAVAAEGEAAGFIVLERGTERRRIPYWGRIAFRALAAARPAPLRRPGTYSGNTAGRRSLVTTYRYPDNPAPAGITRALAGPEQVFRVTLARPVANFGVAIISRARGVAVEPRIVFAGDEDHQSGYASLPFNMNPYLVRFGESELVSAALLPAAGAYDVVFDSRSAATAGRYSFRFWIDDVTPPRVRLLTPRPRRGQPIRLAVTDAGSGVHARSFVVRVDGEPREFRFAGGVLSIATRGLSAGTRTITVQASDRQEVKNMENVPRILPNTRTFRARVRVR